MMSLLLEAKSEGYPSDFLLARLRGRRREMSASSAGRQRKQVEPWSLLQAELFWLYKTMNRRMRRDFGPCFLYFELRRLLIALRRLSGRSKDGMTQLATQPLLNRELVRQLQTADEVIDAVRLLDTVLEDATGGAAHFEDILTGQGYRQLEERLTDLFFLSVLKQVRSPGLRSFFGALVDLHNVLTILKARRWKLPAPEKVLSGGTFTPEEWADLPRAGREPKLLNAISRISGVEGFDVENVEHAMLNRIHQNLHRRARSEPEAFLFLDYLWACYLQTRNLGLQHWAGDQLAAWEKLG